MTDVAYLSFSAYKDFETCGHFFKKTRIEKVSQFTGNIHTANGTALHEVLEETIRKEVEPSDEELQEHYRLLFRKLVSELDEGTQPPTSEIKTFIKQGESLVVLPLPALREKYGDFELIASEEELYEDMDYGKNIKKFKGFIDLIIKTKDGKYIIIDWKSTTWGWDARKKTDPLYTYQLIFYKEFFAKKYNIDESMIETYFGFLKRTAKNNRVEFFRVTSGKQKTKNALTKLRNCVLNIEKGLFIKNRTSCTFCPLYRTDDCRA